MKKEPTHLHTQGAGSQLAVNSSPHISATVCTGTWMAVNAVVVLDLPFAVLRRNTRKAFNRIERHWNVFSNRIDASVR